MCVMCINLRDVCVSTDVHDVAVSRLHIGDILCFSYIELLWKLTANCLMVLYRYPCTNTLSHGNLV